MSFGPDDEVASSCKPWIPFAKVSSIKRHYPELAAQVQKCEEHWSNNSITKKTKALVSLEKKKRRGENRSKLSPTLLLSLILLLLSGAVGVGLYNGTLPKLIDKARTAFSKDTTLLASLNVAQISRDDTKLRKLLEENLSEWSKKVTSSIKSYELYMPWVRLYAFRYGSGQLDGYELKYLKGREPSIAPKDCSVSAWKKRWSEAAKDLSLGWSEDRLKEKTWYQVLHWDPRWIRRRPVQKEWIDPINYYEACLLKASAAAKELKSEFSNTLDSIWIGQRLSQQLGLISQTPVAIDWGVEGVDRLTHPIAILTCLDESYSSPTNIASCSEFSRSAIQAGSWLQQYSYYREVNYHIHERTNLVQTEGTARIIVPNKVNFVGFDYQPELQVFEVLRTSGTLTPEQEQTLRQKFGGVNLFTK